MGDAQTTWLDCRSDRVELFRDMFPHSAIVKDGTEFQRVVLFLDIS
jgi:hypothetical protein